MASGVKPRVKVPRTAAVGDVITIKTLISHKMESGQRKDKEGNIIPQSIINTFSCDFNGQNIMSVDLSGAVSTNPYFQFEATVPEAGDFTFTWNDDDGSVYTETKSVKIG
ncbi:MAG: thiosulfate oxidation carrier complex protein SoxZ [Paracoccaceae bacterium]